MTPTNKCGARAGAAAAFALGLSLAGLQGAGIAAADETASPSATAPVTPSRGSETARSGTGTSRPSGNHRRPVPSAIREATKAVPTALLVRPRPLPNSPAQGAVAHPVAAATAVPRTSRVAGFSGQLPLFQLQSPGRRAVGAASPVAPDQTGVVTAAVNTFLASAADRLSALPASPVTEFMQGALLLVRRTLSGLFPGIGTGTSTGPTTTSSPFTDEQLRDYLLGLAQEQYGGLFGQTVPYYGYYGPYYKYVDVASSPDSIVTSDTNVQVAGIDEADFVENDGRYLYVAQNGQLTIFDSSSAISSQTALSGNVVGEFLAADRLTVITQSGSGWYGPTMRMAAPWYWDPQTTVTVFDVSDRSAPAVVTQTVFDGGYRDARAVDGTVYLVMDRTLALPEPQYTELTVQPDSAAALKVPWDPDTPATYRTYETWESYAARVGPQIATLTLPHAYSVDDDGNLVDLGVLLGAGEIVRPQTGGQHSLVTVVSVDSQSTSAGSHFDDSAGALVYSSGTSIYMTSDALYVASNQDDYSEMSSSTQTRIDRFTISGTDVGWQASGVVPGSPINQFAFAEQDGHLQVATHTWSWQWTPGGEGTGSGTWNSRDDNGVYVLDTVGDTLDVVGSLTGLAPGEQLYAARFVDNMAYLVTFVRTDPLFAIDLSDPTSPTLRGELVIPGFSNYLQPVGDGLLLGIGQERPSGMSGNQLQVSLFDVGDATNPTRIGQQFLDEDSQWSWSEAQFDHHALLYSPEDGLLVIPVYGSGYDSQTGTYHYGQTLAVLHVDASGIQSWGEIHTDGSVIRTARIGDVLYAVSADHVTAYSLTDLSVISTT